MPEQDRISTRLGNIESQLGKLTGVVETWIDTRKARDVELLRDHDDCRKEVFRQLDAHTRILEEHERRLSGFAGFSNKATAIVVTLLTMVSVVASVVLIWKGLMG